MSDLGDLDSLIVKNIEGMPHLLNTLGANNDSRHRQRERKQHQPQRIKDYFATLAKAAQIANEKLVRSGSPIRFCFFQKDGKVYLELIERDTQGNITQSSTREITEDDFAHWIDDVSQTEGLIFDTEG
jgi:uncharacterized FlaG/YvyC family protein